MFGVFARGNVYPSGNYTEFAICQFSLKSLNEVYNAAIARCEKPTTVPKVEWIKDSHSCGEEGNLKKIR